MNTQKSLYDIEVTTIDGERTTLQPFAGKTLLIVNVASKCGFTSQYAGLEQLYQGLKDRGLVVLGFPCNQFGGQEPGADSDIKQFCSLTYNVTFPMFAKVDVNGDAAHPLYQLLKSQSKGILGTEAIKWNFTKFLVNKKGDVLDRFAPTSSPESLTATIEAVL